MIYVNPPQTYSETQNIFFLLQDEEKWTPVHPDILSAPELETIICRIKKRFTEVTYWTWKNKKKKII